MCKKLREVNEIRAFNSGKILEFMGNSGLIMELKVYHLAKIQNILQFAVQHFQTITNFVFFFLAFPYFAPLLATQ